MDEIAAVYQKALAHMEEIERKKEEGLRRLRCILWGTESVETEASVKEHTLLVDSTNVTPAKKRAKRLSAFEENEADEEASNLALAPKLEITRTSATNEPKADENLPPANELMPPPALPISATVSDQSFARPQRAAKLNCEKHLKEPTLNRKLRRPGNDEVQIKLEHEQRASQMHESTIKGKSANKTKSNISIASTSSHDSVVVVPNKTPSIVTIDHSDQSSVSNELEKSQSTEKSASNLHVTRECTVRIKREKHSEINGVGANNSQQKMQKETTTITESSVFSATTTTITDGNAIVETTQTKKTRKKKVVPKPIKVERFSENEADVENPPISTGKRSGQKNSVDKNENSCDQQEEQVAESNAQNATVYEEAIESQEVLTEKAVKSTNNTNMSVGNATISIANQKVDSMVASSGTPSNATVVLGTAPNDATYCTAAAATFVLDAQKAEGVRGAINSDLTFDVQSMSKDGTESQRSSDQSMATARDTLQPRADSLITEDESDHEIVGGKAAPVAKKPAPKLNTLPMSASKKAIFPTKSYKVPVREIFNPLVQSPVKKKVEAFESVAAANKNARNARSKLAKENATPVSSLLTTPHAGRPTNSTTSRYLTPSQSVNLITPNAMAQTKKLPASASKATSLTKSISAGNLRAIASAKAPSRGNSAEDVRRGAHLMAEERKKQRDQRQLQAAQQREAKERERAERLAKAAKEREEKRLKKQQQAEQKQRELLEIQRKLKQQEEEAAAAGAAEVAAQKQKLMKISQQNSAKMRMPPPQPSIQYTFQMLHEDDSTDDEGKVTYKRPPPPNWSLSHVRGPAILTQQYMPTEPIDFLFSVQPRTLDLKEIFPTIDPRHLKRNSSVIWQTPPRYSELPKY